MTSLPIHRAFARVIYLDETGRVLLVRMSGESFGTVDEHVWGPPGEFVDDTEAAVNVAARVVHQYFGMEVEAAALGDVVAATSGVVPTPDDTHLRTTDSYFVLSSPSGSGPDDAGQVSAERDVTRWWSADEIEATVEVVVPAGLADLVRRLASGEEILYPVRLPHHDVASE